MANLSLVKGFSAGSAGTEPTCNAGDLGSIPGLGRSLGEGNSYPLQYFSLASSLDCVVNGVTKSWTRVTFTRVTFTSLHTFSGAVGHLCEQK